MLILQTSLGRQFKRVVPCIFQFVYGLSQLKFFFLFLKGFIRILKKNLKEIAI